LTKINRFVILYNIEGGNILRLWQAIIIISVVAGCLVIKNETVSQKQDEPSLDITVSDQISIRDTLSRDFRSQNIRQEVYYGKPEFFYVSDMLRDQNIKVYPEDEFVAFPDPSFGLGSKITIYRAPVINVLDGQEKKVFRTKKAVISDFLQEKNIELGDKDEISPNIDSQIDGDTVLTITRVSETTITEQITIDFKKIKQDDQNLEKGKTKIVQTGREGIKEKKFQVRRENGLEVERKLISDEVIKKPQDEITAYGTKIVSFGTGAASFYISSGQMIAACNILSKGTRVRVVNLSNGRSVEVTIVGGGLRSDRIIDLSTAAFQGLGVPLSKGIINSVRLEKIE